MMSGDLALDHLITTAAHAPLLMIMEPRVSTMMVFCGGDAVSLNAYGQHD